MAAEETPHGECDQAVTLAFSVLGKRWNGMLLDALRHGPLSFVDLRRAVPGISDAMLSDRLAELAQLGLVSRNVSDGPPVSVNYALDPAGANLLPILTELGQWASENLQPKSV